MVGWASETATRVCTPGVGTGRDREGTARPTGGLEGAGVDAAGPAETESRPGGGSVSGCWVGVLGARRLSTGRFGSSGGGASGSVSTRGWAPVWAGGGLELWSLL